MDHVLAVQRRTSRGRYSRRLASPQCPSRRCWLRIAGRSLCGCSARAKSSGSRPSPSRRPTIRARCTRALPGRPWRSRRTWTRSEHIRAAKEANADAIHPGYGFLAESAAFASAVEAAGLAWVGPPAEALAAGGDKLEAKRIAREAGVPVVPEGGPDEVGFPLLIKAAAGGGGRGMRVVSAPADLEQALAAARREAAAAFGDDRVFCERYVRRPRHVEIQLLGDATGNVIALGRARVLGAAAPPEGARGVAVACP